MMLETLLEEFSKKYDFITEEMQEKIRKEYKSKYIFEEELREELQEKVNKYIKEKKKEDKKNFIPLTDFFSYHLSDKYLHYHLIPTELSSYIHDFIDKTGGNKELGFEMYQEFYKGKVIESLEAAIPILEKNPNLKGVMGTSTKMIKFHEDTLKELGFFISKNTDRELEMIFPDKTKEEREKFRYNSFMSREKLFNREYAGGSKRKEDAIIRQKVPTSGGFISSAILLLLGISLLGFFCINFGINLLGK